MDHAAQLVSAIAMPETNVTNVELSNACCVVTEGRVFNLITRNSQHWVHEVIEYLQRQLNSAEKFDFSGLLKGSGSSRLVETNYPQHEYAANLTGGLLGVAVYHPVAFRAETGRVGDIAFFDELGIYQWLGNAFTDKVTSQPTR